MLLAMTPVLTRMVCRLPAATRALSQASPYFEGLLRWPTAESAERGEIAVEADGMDPGVFRQVIDYCHGQASRRFTRKHAAALLVAADHFLVEGLVRQCEGYLAETLREALLPIPLYSSLAPDPELTGR